MSSSRSLTTIRSLIPAATKLMTPKNLATTTETARVIYMPPSQPPAPAEDSFLKPKTVALAKKLLASSNQPYETGNEPVPTTVPAARERMAAFVTRNQFPLKGKTMVVTGGAGALGSDVVRMGMKEGMNAVITDHPRANFKMIEEDCEVLSEQFGGRFMTVRGDLTQDVDREGLVDLTIKNFGNSLHAVIFSAGLYQHGYLGGATKEIQIERRTKFHTMVNVNVHSPLDLLTAFQPHMMPGTHAVAITSLAGRQAVPGEGLYGLTKFAESGLWKYLAKDFGREYGIACSQVSPSAIKGPMAKGRPGISYPLLHTSEAVAQWVMNHIRSNGNTLPLETNLDGIISAYEVDHMG